MRSTCQKTLKQLRRLLSVAAVLFFILLLCPAFSAIGPFKVIRVTDGDTIKILNNGKTAIIRLVGIDDPETSTNKNEPGQPFCQNYTKNLANLVLNMSVEKNCYGDGRYGRILGVVYVDGKNVNLEMVKAGLAEVFCVKPAKGLDEEAYWTVEKEAREAGRERK